MEDFLTFCSEFEFGPVLLSAGEHDFCLKLNNELISLCRSLPKSKQTEALFFLMKDSQISFDEKLNFFKYYYVPAWSIIYWIVQSCPDDKELKHEDIENAITSHNMAMFLHSLDDHLNDSDLPVTHLTLLLRSQAWLIMNTALRSLADGVEEGKEIVEGFIDEYYASIENHEYIQSIDAYCELFRKQMATWFIVPVLIAKKTTKNKEFTDAVQSAYGSFGIAWRLLDDILDIETDLMRGVHSSIYNCLPENIREHWDKDTEYKDIYCIRLILNYVLANNVIEKLTVRICSELESAASAADRYNMTVLSDEFCCLLRPLKKRQDLLWPTI